MFFFFQAEDGIRDLVRSRGLGDVYKRQELYVCDGLVVLLSALPSPKFQLYVGVPVVVLAKLAVTLPHPLNVDEAKFTTGPGEMFMVIVVSSGQPFATTVRCTSYEPAEEYR